MSLQSNHFPETLDTPDASTSDRDPVPLGVAVREAIELTLLRFGVGFNDAAAVANMTTNCCETNLLKVLSEPATPAATPLATDEEPPPF